jgi:hypothetical protein
VSRLAIAACAVLSFAAIMVKRRPPWQVEPNGSAKEAWTGLDQGELLS